MRRILTFESVLPEISEYEHPRGYSICRYLHQELSSSGIEVGAVENYRDIAWSLKCRVGSKNIFFFVGYLGTKMTEWQLIVCSGKASFFRLLGYNDENERARLARAIHAILAQVPRLRGENVVSGVETPKVFTTSASRRLG